MFDFDQIRFRCSALGEVMSGYLKGWPVSKSPTCQKFLIQMFREKAYAREFEFSNKYTEKGIHGEENGITVFSLVRKQNFKKNTDRVTDDVFTGEYDLYTGNGPTDADEVVDIKCPFSLHTMPSFTDSVNKDYVYQLSGYMALSGAKTATIAYTLVNSPINIIDQEKKKLGFYIDKIDYENTPDHIEGCREIEKNHIFDLAQFKRDWPGYDMAIPESEWQYGIPLEKRCFQVKMDRDEKLISIIRNRCIEAREWMRENLSNEKMIIDFAYEHKAEKENKI